MSRFDLSPEEITEGSLSRALVLLTFPLLAQNLVQIAIQIVDLFWIGQYSDTAVAAIGLAAPINWLAINVIISGTFVAINVLVSQRVGAGNADGGRRAAFNGLLLTGVLGVAVCAAILFNIDVAVGAFERLQAGAVESNVADLAARYVRIYALALVVAGLSDAIEANFLAWGDSRATLAMNVASVATNLVLDPILIFGLGPVPSLGIRGAALASASGFVASLLLAVAFVARGRAGGVYSFETARVDFDDLRELVDIGAPRTMQGIASNGGSMAMVLIVFNTAGAAGLAAYTIGTRVSSLALLSVRSLRNAAQSIVGQNLGAGNPDRAAVTVSTSVAIGTGVLTFTGIAQWLYAPTITTLFVPDIDGRALEYSVAFLRIFAIAYPAGGVVSLVKGGFNAARLTKTTMVLSIVQMWVFQIPLAIGGSFVFGYGVIGVFWAKNLSVVLTAIGSGAYYLHKKRSGMYVRASGRGGPAEGE